MAIRERAQTVERRPASHQHKLNVATPVVDDNLGPTCSPTTMEVCSEEQKTTLKKYMGMTAAERKEIVDGVERAVADLEDKFKSDVAELQATFGRLQEDKDNILKSVNTKELQLLKTIR